MFLIDCKKDFTSASLVPVEYLKLSSHLLMTDQSAPNTKSVIIFSENSVYKPDKINSCS